MPTNTASELPLHIKLSHFYSQGGMMRLEILIELKRLNS